MTRTLAERFRQQADNSLPGSPLYHELLARCADDLQAGGVVAEVFAGREAERAGTVPPLRLMGAVHRLVLEGRLPELAPCYPSVGGTLPVAQAWPRFRAALRGHLAEVRAGLDQPVQTNEVGRCAVLYGGLMALTHAIGLPVRLLEIGASAGLNLCVDGYGYRLADGTVLGDPTSPLQLVEPWAGPSPAPLGCRPRIAMRAGCDPRPIDPTSPDGQRALVAYVWADQVDRIARLRAAFAVAGLLRPAVERAHADRWLGDRLVEPVPGVLTLVWHSVVWQYIEHAERERVERILAAAARRATRDAPLARLSMEPDPASGPPVRFDVTVTVWPEGRAQRLGSAPGHGLPVAWSTP